MYNARRSRGSETPKDRYIAPRRTVSGSSEGYSMRNVRQSGAGVGTANRTVVRGLALGVLALGLGACDILQPPVPRISSVSPANGETQVPLSSSVRATLELPDNGQLDVSTLTDTTVTLTDASGNAVQANRFPEGNTLVVDPVDVLETDTVYRFNVTSGVKTATGASLTAFNSTFSTGDSTLPDGGGLTADRTPVVFTAGGESSTDTRTLTLTNGGAEEVNITGLTITGEDAGRFALADAAPSTLAPGGTRELSLTFTPSGTGPQLAALEVATGGSPGLTIPLGGLGVEGQGGGNEPSLQYIFDTYGLDISTGDEDPSTIGITDTDSNGPVGDTEVAGQFFTKADPAEPVTVEVLAAFAVDNTPVTNFGYKARGQSGAETQVLSLSGEPGLNEQRLNPTVTAASGTATADGTVTFDPGAGEFGFYSFWPDNQFFDERTVYTEWELNTFSNALPLHVRTYPVPGEENAYVLATEEFNLSGSGGSENDYNDIVVIVRNVVPDGEFPTPGIPQAPTLPPADGIAGLQLTNPLGLPYSDRLVLQEIGSLAPPTCDPATTDCPTTNRWENAQFPTTGPVRLTNTGSAPLQLSLRIENDNLFVINGPTTLTLQPGQSQDVTLEFAPQGFENKGVYPAGLVVTAGGQSAGLELRGLYLRRPEGSREVFLAGMVNDLFGYDIDLGANGNGGISNPEANSSLAGEEVRSDYWQAANPANPVTVVQIAAFQTCCNVNDSFRTFQLVPQGSNSPLASMIYESVYSQSVYPESEDGELTQLSVSATGPFDVRSSGYSSNPDIGRGNGRLGVRFWPLKDRSGAVVNNTYLVAQDFVFAGCGGTSTPNTPDDGESSVISPFGPAQVDPEPEEPSTPPEQPTQPASNCDYNDNLFIISNVEPAN